MNKAVFLDRDGVINEPCYDHEKGIYSPKTLAEFTLKKHAKEALALLKKEGYLLIVVSNQPGVAFGAIKETDLEEINTYLKKELGVDAVYNCIHHPHHTGECTCRKPQSGMLEQATQELDIDLTQSYMVGDNLSDIQAGKDCRATYLIADERAELYTLFAQKNIRPTYLVPHLLAAAQGIVETQNTKPQVMIIAAGVGSRMRPITETTPKCLIDVKGKPLIQHQLEEFKRQGFTNIIFCLGFLAQQITEQFQEGTALGLHINYSIEPYLDPDKLTGTAGAAKYAERFVQGKEVIIYYGDNLTNLDFNDLLDFHRKNKAYATMVVRPKRKDKFSTVVELDADKRMTTFIEKPAEDVKQKYYDKEGYENNGIYVFDTTIFSRLPPHTFVDFAKDVFPKLIAEGKPVYGYVSDKFFREIGRMEKYVQFKEEFKDQDFFSD